MTGKHWQTRFIYGNLFLVFILLFAACAPAAVPGGGAPATDSEEAQQAAAPAAEGPVEQVLVGAFDVGPGGDPQGVLYNNGAGNTWFVKLYTPLIMMNADFTQHTSDGALALSWEPNDDATVWTFKLREGVKWHDGEPFTAADLKFTAELVSAADATVTRWFALRPEQVVGWTEFHEGNADEITGVRAVDDTTLEIELTTPNPRFYDDLRGFYALPAHAVDFAPSEIFSTDWWWTRPVGTGPFKFSAFEKDQYMELVPNEFYWDGAPKLEKLINRYFTDETAAVLALESGDIDFTYVSADVAARFEGNDAYQVFSGPSFVTNLFNYNYKHPVWQDERVRQAMLYGIDRASILRDVFGGTAIAAPCQDPYPAFWPEDANPYSYDPAKARELLAAAAADGVSLEGMTYDIPTYYTSQLAKDTLTVMQANLADIGVSVNPVFLDVPTWRTVVDDGEDWDIAYRGTGGGPASYDTSWYTAGNQWGLEDPAFEELATNMNGALTPEAYQAARTALCKYQNEHATFGYWWVSTRYGVASQQLVDFYYFPAPGGGPYVDNSHLWSKR
ncbi:MAG: ABC transporter substrate-binding protein [Caldilineaceae bacterium]